MMVPFFIKNELPEAGVWAGDDLKAKGAINPAAAPPDCFRKFRLERVMAVDFIIGRFVDLLNELSLLQASAGP